MCLDFGDGWGWGGTLLNGAFFLPSPSGSIYFLLGMFFCLVLNERFRLTLRWGFRSWVWVFGGVSVVVAR